MKKEEENYNFPQKSCPCKAIIKKLLGDSSNKKCKMHQMLSKKMERESNSFQMDDAFVITDYYASHGASCRFSYTKSPLGNF